MFIYNKLRTLFAGLSLLLLMNCSFVDESGKKGPTSTHIITPSHYYTTPKAKNLSDRYKENLERLVVSIVRNPKTGRLQFANNIISTGGIGFFTHSASRSPDERYLEIVLGVPEVLDEALDFSSKVDRLFSEYGRELLSVLCSDPVIYKDPDVAGYGLNLSWRSTASAGAGPRIGLERAVLYFSKEEAARFLSSQTSKEAVLSAATVFAVQSDGRASRMVFRPLPPDQQVAVLAPEKKPIDKPVEAPAILEPQITEKDLPSKELATTPLAQPGRTKAAPPPKSPRETIIKKATPSRAETQSQIKESDSHLEKKVDKQPVPVSPSTIDRAAAKQKRPDAPSQHDEQSFPAQPKLPDKPPESVKGESRLAREAAPQKTDKGEKPEMLAPKPGLIVPAEKGEKPRIHFDSELKPPVSERDRPVEKKAENQRVITPPPSADARTKAFQEPDRKLQESIETEMKPKAEVKSEIKARSADAGKTQRQPTTTQAKGFPATDDKGPKTEGAREHKESITLAKKKSDLQSTDGGYIIQVTFPQKAEAERWSGILNTQGYRVSMTSAGQEEIVRLRVGAFLSPLQAKTHLEQLEKQGLKNGVVLQIIQ